MRAAATDKRRLVDAALIARGHHPLDILIAAERSQDPPTAWAPLAAMISDLSGEPVSFEALRRWYGTRPGGAE